jgi:hypothetical protein
MQAPLITALYAAALAVLFVALGVRIALYRMKHRVGLGDGGDARLARLVRAHGNAAENIPLAIALLLVAELVGTPPGWLHGFGATLCVARVLHAYGLTKHAGTTFGRFVGISLTWLVTVALAALLLAQALVGPASAG